MDLKEWLIKHKDDKELITDFLKTQTEGKICGLLRLFDYKKEFASIFEQFWDSNPLSQKTKMLLNNQLNCLKALFEVIQSSETFMNFVRDLFIKVDHISNVKLALIIQEINILLYAGNSNEDLQSIKLMLDSITANRYVIKSADLNTLKSFQI